MTAANKLIISFFSVGLILKSLLLLSFLLIASQFPDQSGVYECLIMLNRATHPLADFPQPRRDRRIVRLRIGCLLFPVDKIFSRNPFDFGRGGQPDDGVSAFFRRPHK